MKWTMILGILTCALAGTVLPATETPETRVSATLNFKGPLKWHRETDIGLMHFYAENELWTVDLMEGGSILGDPIPLEALENGRDLRHIPKTGLLLIANARIPGKGGQKKTSLHAYAIDILNGEVLWENEPLPTPDEVFHYPQSNHVILRTAPGGHTSGRWAVSDPSIFTAVDLDTGKVLWQKELISHATWISDEFLEIAGPQGQTLEAATGRVVRNTTLPLTDRNLLSVFPELERVVIWRKNVFDMYPYPRWNRHEAATPISTKPNKSWQVITEKKAGSALNLPGQHRGPKYMSNRLILLNHQRWLEVVEVETGKTVWEREKLRIQGGLDFVISPKGGYAAMTNRRNLMIYNMKDGSIHADIPLDITGRKFLDPRIMWQSDNEVMVILGDTKGRPHNISRILVDEKRAQWTKILPKHPKYKMTSKEKGALAGRLFLAVAMTAVSANNPIGSAPDEYFYIFIPNLDVKRIPDTTAGLEALTKQVAAQPADDSNWALRRYLKRAGLINQILGHEGLFVTGRAGSYQIQRMDMTTGEIQPVGAHSGDKIHAIEPDAVYNLAVTMEQNRHQVKILNLQSTP